MFNKALTSKVQQIDCPPASLSRSSVGVRETGGGQRRSEGSDRGAEAEEAGTGLHAQPAPADLHRPSPKRPNARGREEPLHPAHQGEHLTTPEPHLLHHHHYHLFLFLHIHLHCSTSRRSISDARSHSLPRSPMSDPGVSDTLLRLAMLPLAAIGEGGAETNSDV